jgi:hypothetical protein
LISQLIDIVLKPLVSRLSLIRFSVQIVLERIVRKNSRLRFSLYLGLYISSICGLLIRLGPSDYHCLIIYE